MDVYWILAVFWNIFAYNSKTVIATDPGVSHSKDNDNLH